MPASVTHTRPNRRAFTLVELTVSLAIATIVLLGSMGTIALASRALPSSEEPGAMAAAFLATAEAINADAAIALEIAPARGAMLLPDADDDGRYEVVEYEITGGVLTRAYNRGTPVTLMRNASRLTMTGAESNGVVTLSTQVETTIGSTYTTSAVALNLDTAP